MSLSRLWHSHCQNLPESAIRENNQSRPNGSMQAPGSLPDKRWDAVLRKGVTGYDGILEIKIVAPPDDCGSHGGHRSPCYLAFVGDLRLALLTIGFQAYRAAVSNPVSALRSE